MPARTSPRASRRRSAPAGRSVASSAGIGTRYGRPRSIRAGNVIPPVTLYGRLATVYRMVPEPARRWTLEHMPDRLLALRQRALVRLEQRADRQELYDDWYYDNVVDPLMRASADTIATALERELRPQTVIDIGCGTGALMLALERRGVRCLGFDAAEPALDRCRRRGLT